MSLQERLQALFDENPNIKPAHVAKFIGRSRTTVGQWLSGKSKTIYDEDVAQKVANIFGCQYDWLVRGIGEKYANNNNDLSTKVDVLREDGLKKNLNSALVNRDATSMLGNTHQTKLSREEKMNFDMVNRFHSIQDGNLIHGISLLLSIDNAKDRDKQLIDAINAISLSVTAKNVEIVVKDTGSQAMPTAEYHSPVKN